MEPVNITKYRAADGEIYDIKEQAIAIDQKIWQKRVANIFDAGGHLMHISDPEIMNLINFLVNRDVTYRNIVYCGNNTLYDTQFTTLYIWRASTAEQANLISTALRKHNMIPSYVLDMLITNDIFTKYLNSTMLIQQAITPKAYTGVCSEYRVIYGLDQILTHFETICKILQQTVYGNPLNNKGDGNDEKL